MKLVIDTEKLSEMGVSLDIIFFLMALYFECNITKSTFDTIVANHYMDYLQNHNGFVTGKITQEGVDLVESVLVNSEITETTKDTKEDRFMVLADKLRELFPQGRKQGTNLQWKDSTVMVCKRLKTLIKNYGVSFTDEEAITATKRYIDSFHGDYRFMQVLRYFLYKKDLINGEEASQFLSYLQNNDDGQDNNSDWNTILR